VVAAGQSVPFVWDGTPADLPESLADLLGWARREREAGRTPSALSALAALVDPAERGEGVSAEVIRAMTALASVHRLDTLVAPVRPALRASYPLVDMQRYAEWRRDDGLSPDPWLRVHQRLGAEIARIAPCTLRITGTVGEWEGWTDMRFPDSGPYVVPGALQPVQIDREKDEGRYDDPNVWMVHQGVSR
jgi:hypothetical protein